MRTRRPGRTYAGQVRIRRRDLLRAGTAGVIATAVGGCAPYAAGPGPAVSREGAALPGASGGTAATRAALPPEVSHGPRDRPRIALTFHGQGPADLASRLLAVLGEAGTRVTVLAVGTWLDEQPDLAGRFLRDGHELGNHTQTHPALAELSEPGAYAEIAACAERLRRLTGSPGAWFRPSQTPRSTAVIRAAAVRAGYRTCLAYDVDGLDYTDPGADAVAGAVLAGCRPGSIVSLHLGYASTVAALPRVLSGLRERGLAPVTATELLG